MVVDVRKLSNGAGPARPVYQHGHFCVRAFHRLLSYPGYSLFIFFLIYLLTMDLILYQKICSRGVLDYSSVSGNNSPSTSESIHIFDPLPIKKIMVEPAVSTRTHFDHWLIVLRMNRFSSFVHHWQKMSKLNYISPTISPSSLPMLYPIFIVFSRLFQ